MGNEKNNENDYTLFEINARVPVGEKYIHLCTGNIFAAFAPV
jgi:hypothetical protein